MRTKLVNIGLVAIACVVVTLLALYYSGVGHISFDDDSGQPTLESLSG